MELLGHYSSYDIWLKKIKRLRETPLEARAEPKVHAVVRKLKPDEVQDLVAGYLAGSTAYELAKRFKVHRGTVSAQLNRQGVPMRGRGMTVDQVTQAAALYQAGWSLALLGERFGVDDETVRQALRQLGVPMRRPWERRG